MRRQGHRLAAHAHGAGDQFLGQHQAFLVHAVQAGQQGAAQLLLDRMPADAHDLLGGVGHDRLHVVQDQAPEAAVVFEQGLHDAGRDPPGAAFAQDRGAVGGGVLAGEAGDADNAFPSRQGEFGAAAVFQRAFQGNDAVDRKVHMADVLSGRVQQLPLRQLDAVQVGRQGPTFACDGVEQMVAKRRGGLRR